MHDDRILSMVEKKRSLLSRSTTERHLHRWSYSGFTTRSKPLVTLTGRPNKTSADTVWFHWQKSASPTESLVFINDCWWKWQEDFWSVQRYISCSDSAKCWKTDQTLLPSANVNWPKVCCKSVSWDKETKWVTGTHKNEYRKIHKHAAEGAASLHVDCLT